MDEGSETKVLLIGWLSICEKNDGLFQIPSGKVMFETCNSLMMVQKCCHLMMHNVFMRLSVHN